MKKLFLRIFGLFIEALDLLVSYRKNSSGIKVFGQPQYLGGPRTKFEQLRPILKNRFEAYSTIYCLSGVRIPLFVLRILKKRGAKILVNQNGVYYPLWTEMDYLKRNRYLKELNDLGDISYFQSEFAKKSYKNWVGQLPTNHLIAYNAVNIENFKPLVSKATLPDEVRILFFTDLSYFTLDAWKHFLSFIKSFPANEYFCGKKLKWVFTGRIFNKELFLKLGLGNLISQPDVEFHFDANYDELKEVLQSSHASFHLIFNDVCPNKVLESMAAGIWVMCTSAGGSVELVGEDSGAILKVKDSYENRSYPHYNEMRATLEAFIKNHSESYKYLEKRVTKFLLRDWHAQITKDQKNT